MKVRSSSAERENCEQSPQVKIRLRRSERVKSEVVNMLCAEYDYDMDIAVQKEESYEDGFAQGKADDILEFLNDIGNVSEDLKAIIMGQDNIDVLKEWLKISAKVSSIEEFRKKADI